MSDDHSAPLSGIELSVALILGSLMGPHNHGTEACQEEGGGGEVTSSLTQPDMTTATHEYSVITI